MNLQPDLFGGADRSVRVDQDALGFLAVYAKRSKGAPFSSEHVTVAAEAQGITFQDQRSWGSVFTQAARLNIIRRSDVLFSRSFGNGSLAPGWVGV